jgi:CBS domain-containing protein
MTRKSRQRTLPITVKRRIGSAAVDGGDRPRNEQRGDLLRSGAGTRDGRDGLVEAQAKLAGTNLRSLPVVAGDDRVRGLLTAADVNGAFQLLSIRPELNAAP